MRTPVHAFMHACKRPHAHACTPEHATSSSTSASLPTPTTHCTTRARPHPSPASLGPTPHVRQVVPPHGRAKFPIVLAASEVRSAADLGRVRV